VGGVTGNINPQLLPQPFISGALSIPSGSGTATYMVTPIGLCPGVPFKVTVNVSLNCGTVTVISQTINANMCSLYGSAELNVVAGGTFPFGYRWEYENGINNWVVVNNNIPSGAVYTGMNSSTLQVSGISNPGFYKYRSVITNCSGANSVNSIPVTLNVDPAPALIITNPKVLCSGETADLMLPPVTAGSSTGLTFSYWINSQASIQLSAPDKVPAGTYYIKGTTSEGCSSVEKVTVTASAPIAPPSISAISGKLSACDGFTVPLQSSPGFSYLWSNGEKTQIINAAISGPYSVRISNSAGCWSASSLMTNVTINPAPAIPEIIPQGDLTFCEGGNVTLTSTSATGYLWSTDETTQSINVSRTGPYSVKVFNESGCFSEPSPNAFVTVNAAAAQPIITADGPLEFCQDGSVTLSASGTGFKWSTGEETPTITVRNSGPYSVQVTTGAGCLSKKSVEVVVKVNSNLTPNFPAIPTLCMGTQAPILSVQSPNGITGTWSPDIINNTVAASGEKYLFTPNSGQCANEQTLVATVIAKTTPSFVLKDKLSLGQNAPVLPAVSLNNIKGSWSPSVINTSAKAITPFTFTPDPTECSEPFTIDIEVNDSYLPVFDQIKPILAGSAAPVLPSISLNGITGTWSPATINTEKTGKNTFTFIPAPGQCGSQISMVIPVVSDSPGNPSIIFEPSLSISGGNNINCFGEKTGSIIATVYDSDGNQINNADYYWTDAPNSNTNIRTSLAAGIYTLTATDKTTHRSVTESITLTEPSPLKITADIIRPLCADKNDGYINITPSGGDDSGIYYFRWFDNSTSSTITNLFPGFYTVELTDRNRCIVKDSIEVLPERDICIFMPQAFSPNGDGTNDYFEIINIDLYPNSDVTVYNRWGQSVWRSEKGYATRFSGYDSRGNELPLDSYHYAIDLHNGSKVIIGTVTIIR
jgi:gliding motility-associated-like protein